MQVRHFIIISAAALMLAGCDTQMMVSRPSTIEEVQRQQERHIDNMQSHQYDEESENNDAIEG